MYVHVSRDGMRLHLSSHHDDGTPGTAVLVEVRNIDALHSELRKRGYPFFNPGIAMVRGASREMQLIDLPPTGFASTSPHRPAKAPHPVSECRTISLGIWAFRGFHVP